jgi:hypothetical protein
MTTIYGGEFFMPALCLRMAVQSCYEAMVHLPVITDSGVQYQNTRQ